MAIEFACHQCGGHFAAPDQLAGKQAKCKRCGAVVTVPIVLPAEQVIAVAPRAAQPAAKPVRQPTTVQRPAPRPVQQPAAMPFDLSAELPIDPSPRTSTYTLPSTAPRREIPWTLIIAACVLVIVVSGVVGVGMTAAYLWPHFAQWMSDAPAEAPVVQAPPPAAKTPDPPPKPTVSPSLSNLPAPPPERQEPKVEEESKPRLESGWGARPDPPLAPVTYKEGKLAISLPSNVQLLLPHGPSHFVLGTVSDFRREAWQVFDLRTGKEIGKTIQQKLDINHRTAAFSPDGRYLAAVRDERESWGREVVVGVWSFATGEMTQALRLKGRVLSGPLCFAAPHQLVTLHDQNFESRLTLWNVQTGEKLRELPLPQGTFRSGLHPESLAVSPGGRYATIILGKQLGVIDLTTGEPAGAVTLPENPSSCEGVMFSPDGTELALLINGSAGHRLLLLDFATGRLLLDHDYRGRFPHFSYDGPPLDWLPDKSGLIVAGHLLLERATGEEVWVFPTTDNNPRRFIRDGQILVLLKGRNGKVLQTADLPEKEIAKLMQSIRDGGAAVDTILPPLTTANLFSATAAVLPTGPTPWSHQPDAAGPMPRGLEREVLVAKGDETIRRVGFASPSSGKVVVQKEVTPRGVVGRRQLRRVVLERYDLASGNKGVTVEVPYVYQFADLSPSGKSAIVAFAEKGNNYERIDVLSLAPKKHVAAWRPYAGEREAEPADGNERLRRAPRLWGLPDSPRSVVWAALLDDDHVLTVNTAGKLICWRLPDCQAVYVFEEFGEPLALSAGRRYLAGNHFGEFRLFDAATGKCVGDLDPPKSGTRAVRGVFRPDGQELAAIIDAGPDKMLARWNLREGKLLEETPLPPDAVDQYVPFHTSQRGARLGLEYRGPNHLMIDDEYLVDLPKQAVTWKYHVSGYYATNSPDHRTWYCTTKPNSPDRALFLTAHDTPSSLVQQKAGAITLEKQLILQPGMSVRLHVDVSGAGVGEANTGVEQAVHEALESRDILVEPTASLTFSVVAAERSTGRQIGVSKSEFFSPFGDPRDYKEVFSQQELVVRMSVSDSTGKVLWHRDRAVSMPTLRVRGDMDASQQLREHMERGFLSMLAAGGSATQSVPRYIFADLPTIIAGASTLGFHQEGPPPQVKLPENQKGPPGIAPGT